MVKALIGIDLDQRWPAAVDLFARLKFENSEAVLLHSVEWLSPGGIFPPVQVQAARSHQQELEARAILEVAARRLRKAGIDVDRVVLEGDPAHRLIEKADDIHADLIVAGSTCKGAFGSMFFGSVGKGLTISAHQSILIAKRSVTRRGPLTAVLATDHSPYMNQCLERLMQLDPRGIGRLVVMTANEVDRSSTSVLVYDIPEMGNEAIAWVQARLKEKTEGVCEILKPLGGKCEARVVATEPIAAIHSTMADIKADLLILGAQGHGFLERLTIGSLSLYEVIAEPFNVLLLRAPMQR